MLLLFWINRFITTITTTNISLNNCFRPTAFPSPQPHPPLKQTTPPSPLYPQPSTSPHHRHRLTFISSNAAIFAPAAERSDQTASLQADAGVCSPCRVFGSRDSVIPATSALRAESEVRGQRCRVDDFHNVRSPRRVRGQRSEVRDRRPNRVSPALYKPAQSTERCQSGGATELRGSLETTVGEEG